MIAKQRQFALTRRFARDVRSPSKVPLTLHLAARIVRIARYILLLRSRHTVVAESFGTSSTNSNTTVRSIFDIS